MPFVKALPVREEAVQHCHGGRQFRETGFETLNRLGRQEISGTMIRADFPDFTIWETACK